MIPGEVGDVWISGSEADGPIARVTGGSRVTGGYPRGWDPGKLKMGCLVEPGNGESNMTRTSGSHDDETAPSSAAGLSRRGFVRAAASLGAGALVSAPFLLAGRRAEDAFARSLGGMVGHQTAQDRFPLRRAPESSVDGVVLRAAPGVADIGSRGDVPSWLINGSLPSPLLRVRRGEEFRATLRNDLDEPLILHWHGLTPPEAMDGHPRLQIAPGSEYEYRFRVDDRPGTYWYHSHAHARAGVHTYRGIAGLIIVEDPERSDGLPTGERDLPVILQDRRLDANGMPTYPTMGPSMMMGVMGDEPFANGIHRPYADVEAAVYRLRVLNGSDARLFRLGLGGGRPLVAVGADGALLSRPVELPWIELAPGERADLLVDFRSFAGGDRVMLRSLEFEMPGMGMMGGGRGGPGGGGPGRGGGAAGGRGGGGMAGMMAAANRHGVPMELLEFRIVGRASNPGIIPDRLPATAAGPDPEDSRRERRFVFTSEMMRHRINGRAFEMDRVDERVPFGETEVWEFVNDSDMPHPVHVHATHFRLLERRGGGGRIMPWESGLKDTALIRPGETVRMAVRFTAQRGLFLLHCHNLTHEDAGMMQNILVE